MALRKTIICSLAVNALSMITVQYYSNYSCNEDTFGVGLLSNCIQTLNGASIGFACDGAAGLVQYTYETDDCSSAVLYAETVGPTDTCFSSFAGNSYFSSNIFGGTKITCDSSNDVRYCFLFNI
jgi:hypothetical protein